MDKDIRSVERGDFQDDQGNNTTGTASNSVAMPLQNIKPQVVALRPNSGNILARKMNLKITIVVVTLLCMVTIIVWYPLIGLASNIVSSFSHCSSF
jgi:hypothetical protein